MTVKVIYLNNAWRMLFNVISIEEVSYQYKITYIDDKYEYFDLRLRLEVSR